MCILKFTVKIFNWFTGIIRSSHFRHRRSRWISFIKLSTTMYVSDDVTNWYATKAYPYYSQVPSFHNAGFVSTRWWKGNRISLTDKYVIIPCISNSSLYCGHAYVWVKCKNINNRYVKYIVKNRKLLLFERFRSHHKL